MIPLTLMIPPAEEETLTCKSTALVWDASGICACPDPKIEVYVSTTKKCLNCTSILSTGIDKENPGNCLCLAGLTYADGKCDCGKTSAYIVNTDGYTCIVCNNS